MTRRSGRFLPHMKHGREHRMPLSDRALKVLDDVHELATARECGVTPQATERPGRIALIAGVALS